MIAEINSDYWTGERVRRISILSRKPEHNHLFYGIPSYLHFAALYPDIMKKFDLNGKEIMENLDIAETCGYEVVKVGSTVTYFIAAEQHTGKIVEDEFGFGFDNSKFKYNTLQELVDIHVGVVIEY